MSCPGAMQIRRSVRWAQSIVSRPCHRISHDMIHMFHLEFSLDTSIIYNMKATHRKIISLAGPGPSGIFGANMSSFAIEVAGQEASVSPAQPTIERLDDKAAARRLARLRSRARLAFGIPSKFGSTSARPAPLGITRGASLGQAWRQLRRWIARSRQRHALAGLDDRLLHDIGVMRERDIGVSREELRREIELFPRT
jgi:uncharacterized protein YjiS (DUF1127 family)